MHGVGIRAMARLMERVMSYIDPRSAHAAEEALMELELVAADCRWSEGIWPELGVTWDALQNNPRHISTLSNFLIRRYMAARRGS